MMPFWIQIIKPYETLVKGDPLLRAATIFDGKIDTLFKGKELTPILVVCGSGSSHPGRPIFQEKWQGRTAHQLFPKSLSWPHQISPQGLTV
jgi:hypothetical protein